MVRAVELHINRCRGGSQNTGQAGAIHHHIGCVVAAQQVEDRIDGQLWWRSSTATRIHSGRPRRK
jgi:hypothetical protein